MERLTERKNGVFVYAGPDCFDFDGMASPAQIAIRNAQTILERLAAYEDSCLTPEEVADFAKIVRCKDCEYKKKAKVNDKGYLICPASGMEITGNDFCSYGEKKGER